MESDSPLPNLLLRQRGRRFRQIAAIDVALMVVLGLVNLVRDNTAQGGLLLGAAAATCGLLWWHARRPGTAAPFVFTLLGIVVVGAVTWMGHGLLDVGNYAFPGIVALASLLLNPIAHSSGPASALCWASCASPAWPSSPAGTNGKPVRSSPGICSTWR